MFLKVDYDLLRCENFDTASKLLLAYFYSLESAGRTYWGSIAHLAGLFGTSAQKMESLIFKMEQKELIFRSGEGYKLAQDWRDILRIGSKTDISNL